jgi:hypothetical protein
MVLQRLGAADRRALDRRCVRIYCHPIQEDHEGCTWLNFDRHGSPRGCEIQLDQECLSALDLDHRLGIIAHEIGHVLTNAKHMPIGLRERLADEFADAIGYPNLHTVR